MCILTILQGLLTPTIGVITTFIAWQQWKGNRLKLNLDRYDRRVRIYQEVVKMVKASANGDIKEFSSIVEFGAATAEADFIFGPEIRQYLDEISSRAAKLRSAKEQYRDFKQSVPEGYDHQKIVDEMSTQTMWFVQQLVDKSEAKRQFAEYLNIYDDNFWKRLKKRMRKATSVWR